eukprot:2787316-Rhodomonas_salina.1
MSPTLAGSGPGRRELGTWARCCPAQSSQRCSSRCCSRSHSPPASPLRSERPHCQSLGSEPPHPPASQTCHAPGSRSPPSPRWPHPLPSSQPGRLLLLVLLVREHAPGRCERPGPDVGGGRRSGACGALPPRHARPARPALASTPAAPPPSFLPPPPSEPATPAPPRPPRVRSSAALASAPP